MVEVEFWKRRSKDWTTVSVPWPHSTPDTFEWLQYYKSDSYFCIEWKNPDCILHFENEQDAIIFRLKFGF